MIDRSSINSLNTGLGALAALGVVLAALPSVPVLLLSAEADPVGAVYVAVAFLVFGFQRIDRAAPTPRRLLGVLLTVPVFVGGFVVLWPRSGHYLVSTPLLAGLLVVPAAIAFPMGVAARSRRWPVLGAGLGVWLTAWTLLIVSIDRLFPDLPALGVVILLETLLSIGLLAVPPFVIGFVVAPTLASARSDVSGYLRQERPEMRADVSDDR